MRQLLAALAALALTAPAAALADGSLFGRTASVTYGPYARAELGAALVMPEDAYWHPAGFPEDPEISFALDDDWTGFASVATGFDWQNGIRAEIALLHAGSAGIPGPCAAASDGSPCSDHADISAASVSTTALMGNLYISPLEMRGSNSVFQPFVVAGIGLASNNVGDWTRRNLNDPGDGSDRRDFRTFEGARTNDFAWSVGLGAALQVTRPGKWPIILEAAWRYYDFGTARGSATPLPGQGFGQPVRPLTFDNTASVATIGIRIPLERY